MIYCFMKWIHRHLPGSISQIIAFFLVRNLTTFVCRSSQLSVGTRSNLTKTLQGGHKHHGLSALTGLRSTPTPGISTSTTSPGARGPTPSGVPVNTKSSGSRLMT